MAKNKKKKKAKQLKNRRNANSIRLDDKQIKNVFVKLEEINSKKTKEIVDSIKDVKDYMEKSDEVNDGFSILVKTILTILFIGIGSVFAVYIVFNLGILLKEDPIYNISVFILLFLSILIFILGIHINKLKSRTYLLSVFSVLIALVSLIISLMKQ